jgi:hypothetical protein
MKVIFTHRGRLGNALFRYMACTIICIKYGAEYITITSNSNPSFRYWQLDRINDTNFIKIMEYINQNIDINLSNLNYLMQDFYQHDKIYIKYKKEIIDFINNNPDHFVITDGITAGDGNLQRYNVKNLITTPTNFNKYYDMVFHIRLDDKITAGIDTKVQFILNLIDQIIFDIYKINKIAIVCQAPTTNYEKQYISQVINKLSEKIKCEIIVESNDIITDFNIIKNCKILISSISTICWCASFFSTTIEKCYMPILNKRISGEHCTFRTFIENTDFYKIE